MSTRVTTLPVMRDRRGASAPAKESRRSRNSRVRGSGAVASNAKMSPWYGSTDSSSRIANRAAGSSMTSSMMTCGNGTAVRHVFARVSSSSQARHIGFVVYSSIMRTRKLRRSGLTVGAMGVAVWAGIGLSVVSCHSAPPPAAPAPAPVTLPPWAKPTAPPALRHRPIEAPRPDRSWTSRRIP